MSITDMPILGMLRTKMAWHQERQRLLSENVANADTPGFQPRDLQPPDFSRQGPVGGLALSRTAPGHAAGITTGGSAFRDGRERYDIRPSGNAVSLEDEMLKVAANQMDYQAATTLYTKSLTLLKTAVGRR